MHHLKPSASLKVVSGSSEVMDHKVDGFNSENASYRLRPTLLGPGVTSCL